MLYGRFCNKRHFFYQGIALVYNLSYLAAEASFAQTAVATDAASPNGARVRKSSVHAWQRIFAAKGKEKAPQHLCFLSPSLRFGRAIRLD
jgi:hypothetical protein